MKRHFDIGKLIGLDGNLNKKLINGICSNYVGPG
jgi:hypothetical protein